VTPSPIPILQRRRGSAPLQSLAAVLPHHLYLNAEHGYVDDLLVLMLKNKLLPGLPLLWRGIEGEAFLFNLPQWKVM